MHMRLAPFLICLVLPSDAADAVVAQSRPEEPLLGNLALPDQALTAMPAEPLDLYGYRAEPVVPTASPLGARLPVLHHWFWPPHLRHGDPDDPGRHVGLGLPLVGTSWRNRPWHAGWLVGGMFGDNLIPRRVSQDEDLFGGYRIGWDFDHYWGAELRFAFAHLDLTDLDGGGTPRTSGDQFYDLNLAYYPWEMRDGVLSRRSDSVPPRSILWTIAWSVFVRRPSLSLTVSG